MDDINYKHIKIFQAIVEEQSVRKAATKMGITASSVSKSLKALELSFDLLLFTREYNKLEVTQEGIDLYEKSRTIVEQVDSLLDSIRERKKEPQGRVRITLSKIAYSVFLKNLMGKFHRQFPLLEIELVFNDLSSNFSDEVVDIGIDVGENIRSNYVAKRLSPNFKQALFASKQYFESICMPEEVSDLRKHKLIRYNQPNGKGNISTLFRSEDKYCDSRFDSVLTMNDCDAVKDFALEGLGIGMLPQDFIQKELDAEKLLPILPDHWLESDGLFLYFHQKMQKSMRVRVLIDFLVENAMIE